MVMENTYGTANEVELIKYLVIIRLFILKPW